MIEVDRFFPSTKLCNCCKFKNNSLNLSIREWVCPNCQTHHDRDENAAKNIREEGIRILSTNTVGHTGIEVCGEDVRLVAACCKKHSSVKQESPVERVSLTGECQFALGLIPESIFQQIEVNYHVTAH
ncbi:zinc ribbon domain-containing protein [Planktothrix agardhii]|uniref:zinc ribbon domain-containing protein n=1 Tax=Planktothrix agardhii TaxID=1160 RepID=UPI000485A2CF|nr:zinc ribbon domain-containing protein [Planktothrix agardhii]